MNENVVLFPNAKKGSVLSTLDDVIKNVEGVRTMHINEVIESVFPQFIEIIQDFGFLTDGDKIHEQDIYMMEVCLRAAPCRYSSLDHPLHQYTDMLFNTEDQNNETD